MRKLVTLILMAVMALAIIQSTGCNTMRGAGRDVERVGEGVQDAAR